MDSQAAPEPGGGFAVEHRVEVCSTLGQNPSVGRTASGDLFVLHTDLTDCMADCRLFLRRSTDGGLTWSPPELTIASSERLGGVEGTVSCVDPLIFIVFAEGVELKRRPQNPRRCKLMWSADSGHSWSKPMLLEGPWGPIFPFGKIIRLQRTRQLLLPVFTFFWRLKQYQSRLWMLASDDEGRSWTLKGRVSRDAEGGPVSLSETSVVELPGERLLAISRSDAKSPEAMPYGMRSVSDDGGATWSRPEPINVQVCEPRLLLTSDGRLLLVARSWPGNVYFYYRRLLPEERQAGSEQQETVAVGLRQQWRCPVRDFGVILFESGDEGRTFQPLLTVQDPRGLDLDSLDGTLQKHRYQAGYGDIQPLGNGRYLVVFRQGDPSMPDIRPGLTYSHVFQRFVAGNIIVDR